MKKLYSLLAVLSISISISAQLNLVASGTAVTENFDGIGATGISTLPTNWTTAKSTTLSANLAATAVTATATEQALTYNLAMSSAAGNGIWNFGGGSATDRAVGGISSGSASKTIAIQTQIRNTTTSSFDKITVSFDTERYRNGTNAAGFKMALWYSLDGTTWTNAASSTFTANADNLGSTSNPMETKGVTVDITQTLAVNATMYLQWVYSVTSTTTTSNAQALGLDNVSITGFDSTLAVTDLVSIKSNFVKNTFVENEINFGAKAEVKIFSMNGQLVKSANVSENKSLEVSDLEAGMYIVTGTVNGEAVSQKIIKK